MIKPIGNKIIVRLIKEQKTKSGIFLANSMVGEKNGNVWGELIALPEVSENMWIKTMKVGGRVLYKRFLADNASDRQDEEDFEIVDVEPNEATRPGQVMAYEPPKTNEENL